MATEVGNIINRLQGLKHVGRRVKPENDFMQDLEAEDTDVSGTAKLPEFSNFLPASENMPEADQGGELTSQSFDVRANTANPPPAEPEGEGFFYNLGKSLKSAFTPSLTPEFQQQFPNVNTNIASKEMPEQATEVEASTQVEEPYTPPNGFLQSLKSAFTPNLTPEFQQQFPNVNTNIASKGMPEQATEVEASTQVEEPYTPPNGFLQSLTNEASKPYGMDTINYLNEKAAGINKGITSGFMPSLDDQFYSNNPQIPKPPETPQQIQQKQLDQNELDEAERNPWQIAAYGATDAFANNPEMVSKFQEYTGINFDEQQKAMTEKYEKVISDLQKGNDAIDASYDEQEAKIKERILNNQSNDADKYFIGMALLMPLIVGGLFGKEAALGALGGTAKGFADILGQRQKDIRTDEETLLDIYKQRGQKNIKNNELELEKLKLPETIKKNMPEDEYKDLKGMKIHQITDPKTGEYVGEGPEILPGLVADLNFANTAEKRKESRAEAVKLASEKSALEQANKATSNVIKAAQQLNDPGLFGQILAYGLSEDNNGALKKIVKQNAPMIKIDGRMQNAAVYLDANIEQIKDAYRRNEQMKAFTNTVANHIGEMVTNPLYAGLKPEDLIDQVLILRDRGQNFFIDRAASQGFFRQPLESKFGKVNRELYSSLNHKEENKELARDKALLNGSD